MTVGAQVGQFSGAFSAPHTVTSHAGGGVSVDAGGHTSSGGSLGLVFENVLSSEMVNKGVHGTRDEKGDV